MTQPQPPGPSPARPLRADAARRRSPATLAVLALLAVALCFGFVELGNWQVRRRAWKLDLISRVDHRVHAPPVPAPGPDRWAGLTAASDAYRHVWVQGVFLNADEVRVQAVSDLGAGSWVLTPLRTGRGFTVLVNRGFVLPDHADPATRAKNMVSGPTTVTGLLRVSEPHGGFLQTNDPTAGRWYSRDVAAIAKAKGLSDVAPYFIDADATPNPGGWPVGGLTVISFPNSHLVYAVTWYTLALMVASGIVFVAREERRARRPAQPGVPVSRAATP